MSGHEFENEMKSKFYGRLLPGVEPSYGRRRVLSPELQSSGLVLGIGFRVIIRFDSGFFRISYLKSSY